MRRELAALERQIAEQAKRIAELERQLALRQQNSTTTSKPPSSDGLAGRQRERGRRTKSRRKPAGQSRGHRSQGADEGRRVARPAKRVGRRRRQLLREVLAAPLKFTREGRTYRFSAPVVTGQLIAGAVPPTKVASLVPASWNQIREWLRLLEGLRRASNPS